MKILLSLLCASASAYVGDGKCDWSLFGRKETCNGNNPDDACCTPEELCTMYSDKPDFIEHFPDLTACVPTADTTTATTTADTPVVTTADTSTINPQQTTTPKNPTTTALPTPTTTKISPTTTKKLTPPTPPTTTVVNTTAKTTTDMKTPLTTMKTTSAATTPGDPATLKTSTPLMSTTKSVTMRSTSSKPETTKSHVSTTMEHTTTEDTTPDTTTDYTTGYTRTMRPRPTGTQPPPEEAQYETFRRMLYELLPYMNGGGNTNINYAPVNTNVQNFVDIETDIETNINVNWGGQGGRMPDFNRNMAVQQLAEKLGCSKELVENGVRVLEQYLQEALEEYFNDE